MWKEEKRKAKLQTLHKVLPQFLFCHEKLSLSRHECDKFPTNYYLARNSRKDIIEINEAAKGPACILSVYHVFL